jgi:hypothetical protein
MTTRTDPASLIDGADLVELAEILEFLSHWLSRDERCVAASFDYEIGGLGCYDLDAFCEDLDRLRRSLDAHTGRRS